MPNDEDIVLVQVTYAIPQLVYQWAIAQAQKGSPERGRNVDHSIAILIAAHKETRVIEVHTKAA